MNELIQLLILCGVIPSQLVSLVLLFVVFLKLRNAKRERNKRTCSKVMVHIIARACEDKKEPEGEDKFVARVEDSAKKYEQFLQTAQIEKGSLANKDELLAWGLEEYLRTAQNPNMERVSLIAGKINQDNLPSSFHSILKYSIGIGLVAIVVVLWIWGCHHQEDMLTLVIATFLFAGFVALTAVELWMLASKSSLEQ